MEQTDTHTLEGEIWVLRILGQCAVESPRSLELIVCVTLVRGPRYTLHRIYKGQDTKFEPGGDKETSYMYELGRPNLHPNPNPKPLP